MTRFWVQGLRKKSENVTYQGTIYEFTVSKLAPLAAFDQGNFTVKLHQTNYGGGSNSLSQNICLQLDRFSVSLNKFLNDWLWGSRKHMILFVC